MRNCIYFHVKRRIYLESYLNQGLTKEVAKKIELSERSIYAEIKMGHILRMKPIKKYK